MKKLIYCILLIGLSFNVCAGDYFKIKKVGTFEGKDFNGEPCFLEITADDGYWIKTNFSDFEFPASLTAESEYGTYTYTAKHYKSPYTIEMHVNIYGAVPEYRVLEGGSFVNKCFIKQ